MATRDMQVWTTGLNAIEEWNLVNQLLKELRLDKRFDMRIANSRKGDGKSWVLFDKQTGKYYYTVAEAIKAINDSAKDFRQVGRSREKNVTGSAKTVRVNKGKSMNPSGNFSTSAVGNIEGIAGAEVSLGAYDPEQRANNAKVSKKKKELEDSCRLFNREIGQSRFVVRGENGVFWILDTITNTRYNTISEARSKVDRLKKVKHSDEEFEDYISKGQSFIFKVLSEY